MIKLHSYGTENHSGRCTSRDEYGNADINGVDMSFLLGLPYEEMALVTQALNRLADFEDAEYNEEAENHNQDSACSCECCERSEE